MILLTKNCEWSLHAGRLAQIVFGDDLVWLKGNVGDPMPEIPEGDIISFLSPWIIPAEILAGRTAINFHPGSTNYPGIGCYNFALHENASEYGCVCHYMHPKVDTGAIIKEVKISVLERDTVETLKYRTMVTMLQLFHEFILWRSRPGALLWTDSLKKKWTRKPFTRKQLDQLYADYPNTRATIYPDRKTA